MSKVLLFLILSMMCMGMAEHIKAQEASLPICPPTVVGSGARALGMGDAFVAIADDATAASWNPAGLVQLQKPEMSLVFSYERGLLDYKAKETYYETDGIIVRFKSSHEKVSFEDLNYLSFVYPTSIASRNIVFSFNYQHIYNFSRDFQYEREVQLVLPGSDPSVRDPDMCFVDTGSYYGEGDLYTVSPAVALQINPKFALGLTTNIWSDTLTNQCNWEHTLKTPDAYPPVITEKYYDFEAVNVNFGFFWMINPQLTLAGVYKIPFRARVKREIEATYNDPNYEEPYGDINKIDFPDVLALGVAFRISDALTISTDITRTDWDRFSLNNREGEKFGLFTEIDPDTYQAISQKVKPTYAVRAGIEYLKILEKTVIPFRAGFFYDPIPSINNPLDSYGMTLGSGISLGEIIVDIAYQYRFATKIPGKEVGLSGLDQDIEKKSHQIVLSGIYYF
ncbi:MAG: OmpP1/FadL family transporter [bacterium]